MPPRRTPASQHPDSDNRAPLDNSPHFLTFDSRPNEEAHPASRSGQSQAGNNTTRGRRTATTAPTRSSSRSRRGALNQSIPQSDSTRAGATASELPTVQEGNEAQPLDHSTTPQGLPQTSLRRQAEPQAAQEGHEPRPPDHALPPQPQTPPRQGQRVTVRFAESPGEDFDFSGLPPVTPSSDRDARNREMPSHQPLPAEQEQRPPTPHQTPHWTPRRTPRPVGGHRTPANRPLAIPRSAYHQGRRAGTSGGKRAKDVWNFFPDDGGCRFCKLLVDKGEPAFWDKYSDGTSTDARRKHLAKYHLKPWIEACVASDIPLSSVAAKNALQDYRDKYVSDDTAQSSSTSASNSAETQPAPFSREAMVDAIMDHIIADDESINVIESPFFRKMIRTLRNDLKDSDIPHRDTMRKRIIESLDEHLNNLADEIKETAQGSMSFTDDLWTDQKQQSFMAITGHWVQAVKVNTSSGTQIDLVYRSDLIGFIRVPGRHTGGHLAQSFLFALNRLNLTDKVGWITSDNASNNDTFMEALAGQLQQSGRMAHWDATERRIRCFAHIINLAGKASILILEDSGNKVISRLRRLVRFIRSSGLRRDYFATCTRLASVAELQLILDVDTRWSSTFLMIRRALYLRLAISRFFTGDEYQTFMSSIGLTAEDWNLLQRISNILEVPHLFQQHLSYEKTPALSIALPAFEAVMQTWEEQLEQYPELADAIDAGMQKLSEYTEKIREVPAYVLAMAVNPLVKLDFYTQIFPSELPQARDCFIRAVEECSSNSNTCITATPPEPAPSLDFRLRFLQVSTTTGARAVAQSAQREVELYLAEDISPLDSLTYWKENRNRYPRIFRLAMDILPIQGTSVPCERVFSSAKETITDRRSLLSAAMMEALQILKFTLRTKGSLNFSEGLSSEAQFENLEALTHNEHTTPAFMKAFLDAM